MSFIKSEITLGQGTAQSVIDVSKYDPCALRSENAHVVSVLQTGKVIANAPGETFVWVEEKGRIVYALRCRVTACENAKPLPLLLNRYNRIHAPAGELKVLPSSYCAPKKTIELEAAAADAFVALCEAAKAENSIWIYANQGYRSLEAQERLIAYYTEREGREAACKRCAPAGFSEHHSGLAIDVGGGRYEETEKVQDRETVYSWIAENGYRFGFFLKNLKGKEHITGTRYEPWHIRYLGDETVCRILYEKQITLDEYLDMCN